MIMHVNLIIELILPDCLRLKRHISISSSLSWGGCKDADRTEGPFGILPTANSDMAEEGTESSDVSLPLICLSIEVDGLNDACSMTSTSDDPLPVASGILFRGLSEEEERRCLVLL